MSLTISVSCLYAIVFLEVERTLIDRGPCEPGRIVEHCTPVSSNALSAVKKERQTQVDVGQHTAIQPNGSW